MHYSLHDQNDKAEKTAIIKENKIDIIRKLNLIFIFQSALSCHINAIRKIDNHPQNALINVFFIVSRLFERFFISLITSIKEYVKEKAIPLSKAIVRPTWI